MLCYQRRGALPGGCRGCVSTPYEKLKNDPPFPPLGERGAGGIGGAGRISAPTTKQPHCCGCFVLINQSDVDGYS